MGMCHGGMGSGLNLAEECVTNVFEWIEQELQPRACDSVGFIYDEMDSQSGRSLPIIYQPFDAGKQSHWRDRGAVFDFLLASDGAGKKVLDFGPGDGWPALIVAPFVEEVVGVDGSQHRVQVCRENAARLDIGNARFLHAPPGTPLPFADDSFDAVMAASSVEQSPDPRASLAELWRVLRPGGRLRLHYEALARYRGDREQDLWITEISAGGCRIVLYDRRVEEERVVQYGLTVALSRDELIAALAGGKEHLEFGDVSAARLERLRGAISDARICTTIHPSGKTWALWAEQVGFRQVMPSHDGIWVAGQLFEQVARECRPQTLDEVDAYLQPIIQIIVQMSAPRGGDPPLTAVK